jgi:hypothetical protein
MSTLLPPNFEQLLTFAVQQFWTTRGKLPATLNSQGGGRDAVVSGKNLDGFAMLFREVALHSGIEDEYIFIAGDKQLTIPGYFRSTKKWDALVVYKGRLLAALELKSQVGSFGNNYNNRSEEAVGLAQDFWTAFRDKAFDLPDDPVERALATTVGSTKPPFLAFMMLLEDCDKSSTAVRVDEAHFRVFPEFQGASYSKRYEILIDRLVSEKLYSSGSLILSNSVKGAAAGEHWSPKVSISPKSLFADFAAHLLAFKETN